MKAPQGGSCPISALSTKKGFELAIPYHWQINSNRDLTLTPHLYTGVLPAIEVKYRELNSIGAYQVGGFLTYGTIDNVNPLITSTHRGIPRLFRGEREVPARSAVEHHQLIPRRERQNHDPALRHHQ